MQFSRISVYNPDSIDKIDVLCASFVLLCIFEPLDTYPFEIVTVEARHKAISIEVDLGGKYLVTKS